MRTAVAVATGAVVALAPAIALAGGGYWPTVADYQETVFQTDVEKGTPSEVLVANSYKSSEIGYAASTRNTTDRPLEVDPKTVKATCPASTNLYDFAMAPRAFAVSPDGTMIALFNKKARRVRINDATGTGNLVTFEGHVATHLEWSPSSKRFALAEPAEKGAKTRILLAELPSKAKKEVLLDAPVSMLRFSWDGETLYALSTRAEKLFSIDPASGAVKTAFSRPGLHWFLPGPKALFVADERAYSLVDPAKPDAPKTIYTPKDRGLVVNAEWTADGKALFLLHADTATPCLRKGKVVANDHTHEELIRIDAETFAAKKLLEYAKGDPFVHTIWRSPDGARVAALGYERLRVFDSAGNGLYETAGGDSMRWARDGRSLMLASEDELLSIDVADWVERRLTRGVPTQTTQGDPDVHLVDPDTLGGKVLFTLIWETGNK